MNKNNKEQHSTTLFDICELIINKPHVHPSGQCMLEPESYATAKRLCNGKAAQEAAATVIAKETAKGG